MSLRQPSRSAATSSLIALILLAATGTGCGRYFPPDRDTWRRVEESEIIGTWRLTNESLQLLVRDGYSPGPTEHYTIRFAKGGTCSFSSVIEGLSTDYVDAPCTWELLHKDHPRSQGKKNHLEVAVQRRDGLHGIGFSINREHWQFVLWDFHGDPDEWEYMEYERIDPPLWRGRFPKN